MKATGTTTPKFDRVEVRDASGGDRERFRIVAHLEDGTTETLAEFADYDAAQSYAESRRRWPLGVPTE